MNEDERGSWYLLTGLVIGIAAGLFFAWVIQPMGFAKSEPASLRSDYKERYRVLIAAAFEANGDLLRARARLEKLGDDDLYRTLSEQAQHYLASQGDTEEARALGNLAVALGRTGSPVSLPGNPNGTPGPTETPGLRVYVTQGGLTAIPLTPSYTPTLTSTPVITAAETITATTNLSATLPLTGTLALTSTLPATAPARISPTETTRPRPTATTTQIPSPTPGGVFVLQEQRQVCDPEMGAALLQVEARDASGQPAPGLEVVVTWQDGEEHFFTGLKPELGAGYADFDLEPGVAYTVRLEQAGQPVTGLSAPVCEDGSQNYTGGWYLLFSQP